MNQKLNEEKFRELVKNLIVNELKNLNENSAAKRAAKKDLEAHGHKFNALGSHPIEKSMDSDNLNNLKKTFDSLSEDFFDDEDEDNLGVFSGDFDPNEFHGKAKTFAKKDIKADGGNFEDLGKNKFEKNLNPDEFTADLKRQNLKLPNDKKELGNIKNTLDKRYKHEKKFGVGSLNETGEWSDDEEGTAWKEHLKGQLDLVDNMLTPGLPFFIKGIKGFDKYQGPYAIIEIDDDTFKVWLMEDNDIWIEGFPVDNTSEEGSRAGFLGSAEEVADVINQKYSILTHMNEWTAEEEGPQPGDSDYHNEKPHNQKGIGEFKNIDWQILHEIFDANTEFNNTGKVGENTKYMEAGVNDLLDDGFLSREELDLLENHGIIEIAGHYPILSDEKYSDYNTFLQAAQHAFENGFDQSQIHQHDDSEAAYFRGSEGGGMDEGNVNPNTKLDRPKDAEGNPLTLKARVVDLGTKSTGRVLRFGVDDKGNQTVHVEWIQNFGGKIPQTITYPNKIVVRDEARIVREEEIEEGIGQSFAIGKGQNVKPGNYPQTLKRVGMNENLDQAKSLDNEEVFLVINDAFNRAHYRDLIGQTFTDAPAYAKVKVVKPEEVEAEKLIIYDEEPKTAVQQEDFDFAGEEVGYHNKEEHGNIESLVGKNIVIDNMDYINDILFKNNRRIRSILDSIKEEIASERVINNIIAATDNMDTVWIFEVNRVDNNTVHLKCTGTAK